MDLKGLKEDNVDAFFERFGNRSFKFSFWNSSQSKMEELDGKIKSWDNQFLYIQIDGDLSTKYHAEYIAKLRGMFDKEEKLRYFISPTPQTRYYENGKLFYLIDRVLQKLEE